MKIIPLILKKSIYFFHIYEFFLNKIVKSLLNKAL